METLSFDSPKLLAAVRTFCAVQSGLQVAVDDRRMNVVGSTPVVAQGYTRLIAPNAHRPEALRRPAATESLRHYAQPDVTPSLSSLSQSQDVHGMSAVPRGPLAFPRGGANQTARVLDHQVGSMRCETCTRRAMFVCSACRKAPYCSVECQVCYRHFCHYNYLHYQVVVCSHIKSVICGKENSFDNHEMRALSMPSCCII